MEWIIENLFIFLTTAPPANVALFVSLIGIFLYLNYLKVSKRVESYEAKKENLEAEYFEKRDTITFLKYSLTQIEEYYVINKNQARNTYWAAIVVSILGFIGIVTVIAGWTSNVEDLRVVVPLSGIAASIFLEFIAFSLLNIYRATLQQLNSYFVQLVRVQELLLSLDLINKLEIDTEREARKSEVITTLLNAYKNPFSVKTPELELKARQRVDEDKDKPVEDG